MLHGVIVAWFPERSYGFISAAGGQNVFFHRDGLVPEPGGTPLAKGQPVQYTLSLYRGKTVAVNVRRLAGGAS